MCPHTGRQDEKPLLPGRRLAGEGRSTVAVSLIAKNRMDEMSANPPPDQPQADPRAVARVIHLSLALSVILTFAVFLFLRSRGISGDAGLTDLFRLIGYAIVAAGALVVLFIRSRIPARRADDGVSDWWTDHQARALLAWALAEGAGLAGVVIGWVGDSLEVMVLGVAVSLALLFITRPKRLEGEYSGV